ncbi:putative eukaryotic translation initiation factor 2 subunit beta [Acrodontium crateriforme]|uniref:Eukaryotic translation initiation factor 2 subunit beta n=1 Tax=Acrodontium crateriforme TaxID=150365 RepID=A0AAQ3M472_9PEZI|nr:putative eukaryotic translation initiation factor 2 subunit beta [Acrodontium crateriforme]
MADSEVPDRKHRKSVAFAEGQTVVDANGQVTEHTEHDGEKESAASHSRDSAGGDDKQVDEMTAMFEGLAKKKKKKSSKSKEEGDDEDKAEDDGEVDLSALKKKKKSKKSKTSEVDDFEAKLAQAGAAESGDAPDAEAEKEEETGVQEGDLVKGTGIWAHDEVKPINYESLLHRFFAMLHDSHPDLASSGGKSYKIPPPQCLREGNKKTIFANIAEICKRMKRTDEHVTQFLFAELGTSGSVDGSRRLVIKGRFQQKQIENVLRRYIVEYVTCKTCRSPDTELNKGENRLYFVTCNSCGSRRSVTAIKTGFSAQVGKRKRMQA